MKLLKTLFMAALFSFGATYAHACGVDSVSGKTDTSITISWDVNCNKFLKIEICWKNATHSGNVCIPPAMAFYTTTGSYTIEGLQPETPYKIKTHWRTKNSAWREITTRIVTTDSPPTATTTVLRYEKGSKQKYCVDFYWKNPPPSNSSEWTLALRLQSTLFGLWTNIPSEDLTKASYNGSTKEYTVNQCDFSVNRKYRAYLYKKSKFGKDYDSGPISNWVRWK